MNKQKKYIESKKNLEKENTDLIIENQVIKKQLTSIRNMLDEILGDKTEISTLGREETNEYIREKVSTYLNAINKENKSQGKERIVEIWDQLEKELSDNQKYEVVKGKNNKVYLKEKKPSKCLNCQTLLPIDSNKTICAECWGKELNKEQREKAVKELIKDPNLGKEGGSFVDELKKRQAEGASKPSDYKKQETVDALPYKCVKCGVEGDDEASYKKHDGRLHCLDCLDELMRG